MEPVATNAARAPTSAWPSRRGRGVPQPQRRPSAAGPGPAGAVDGLVARLRRSAGRPLDAAARAVAEPRLGTDLARVRVHDDHEAAHAAGALQARAFTVGRDVFFAAGQYSPETADGRRLLAHELTHVVQQRSATASERVLLQPNPGRNLTATRFAGNRLLERVYDGTRVLEDGSQGTAVRLVQESLLAQGYALPAFGADGDFGAETEAAVRAFQIDAGALLLDGIVGSETMHLLDMHDPGGTVAGPAAPPGAPAATGAVFSEAPVHTFAGYDGSAAPPWLVVPESGRRIAAVTITPAGARPAITSTNPAVATVATTADGVVVTGVRHGTTEVHVTEGGVRLARLRVAVKHRVDHTVAFHYVSDSAVPPNRTTGTRADSDGLRARLNQVWERQANVRFTDGGSADVVVPGNLGAAVDWTTATTPPGGEWNTVTATSTGANYNVFRVWHYLQDGRAMNDAANLGVNTLIGDNPCADGWGLPHEAGHFLGVNHPDGFIMTPCGGRVNQRVSKAMADTVNP